MSKIGEELEKRLDENKYDLYEACKIAKAFFESQGYGYTTQRKLEYKIICEVLAKIEGV